jgi:hypothetical protein
MLGRRIYAPRWIEKDGMNFSIVTPSEGVRWRTTHGISLGLPAPAFFHGHLVTFSIIPCLQILAASIE